MVIYLSIIGYLCLLQVGCYGVNGLHFLNEFAVKLSGNSNLAREVARMHDFQYVDEMFDGIYVFRHNRVARRSLDRSDEHKLLADHPKVEWVEQQRVHIRVKRDLFSDPDWPKQWYLNKGDNQDMNVIEAYRRFGVTGEGIIVTIMDDGIEKNHTDLRDNYDSKASFDFNDNDDDPQPRYDFTDFNRHGTRCAGEVAAVANNDKCGVGVAYKAKIGGIRMLDGDITDLLEARSVSYNNDHIDIYSASWGPTDDGATLDGPGKLTFLAFEKATREGRRGLGSIFVWASGNGGRDNDNCNADGYASLIYTISVSSASENGASPFYSEKCSSTFATTYSSGFSGDRQIATTDLHDLCTKTHSGTSASAPLAAGILALALQVNPRLTWRDVQHIVVMSSKKKNLQEGDWEINGAGRFVSHKFGFGLMDAGKLVELAKTWSRVPGKKTCTIKADFEPISVSERNQTEFYLEVDGCNGTDDEINYLEHVQAFITFSSSNRGQTEIFLQSPNGTNSTLITERPRDKSADGFKNWPFMSTHHWGENPGGEWKLVVACKECTGTLQNWTLVLHGTKSNPTSNSEPPRMLKDDERICAGDEYYLSDNCYKNCPILYYPTQGLINVTSTPDNNNEILNISMCLPCHYTCSYCSGPEKFNCTACSGELGLIDNQCLDPKLGDRSLDIYILGAIFVAVTFASIIISISMASLLTKCRNRKVSFNEQNDPLLGDG